jgi:hypothetical protein
MWIYFFPGALAGTKHPESGIQYHLYPFFGKVQMEETHDLSLATLTG